ncbi:MAG: hypothetical protein IPK16_05405 [Anaerolineales bacterium]|nr:hypothetical protein [Anaerolineales bacterium]
MLSRNPWRLRVMLVFCLWMLAGVNGAFTVHAEDLCTWTASLDGDWNRAGNWSCGHIPTNTDTVVIGPAPMPARVTAAATAATLIIEAGGELFYNAGAGVDFAVGAFTIADGGRYIHKRTATNPISGSNRAFAPNSTVEIQSFSSPSTALPIFGNLTVSNTTAIQFSGKLGQVAGVFTKKGGGELRLSAADSVSLTIAGNLEILSGTLLMQSINTNTAVTLTVAGDVRIASGAALLRGTSVSPWIHTVGGDWIDEGLYTPGAAGNSTVHFNASGAAHLTRLAATAGDTETFCNVSIAAGTVLDTGTDFIAVGAWARRP